MKITLVLMVKDEAKTIEDTLRSWLPVADHVVVVDTGSTDGTRALVADTVLKWIQFSPRGARERQGRAFEQEWADFATNRNQALELASKEFPGTWLVMVDADTRLHGAEALRSFLTGYKAIGEIWDEEAISTIKNRTYPTPDSFKLRTRCGNLAYPMHRVFLAGSSWRYVGAVHEVPVCGGWAESMNDSGPTIPGCWVEYVGSDRREKRATWEAHVDMLETRAGLDLPSTRTVHYLAQTYACLGNEERAEAWYNVRWETHDGYEPERWRAGLCLARLQMRNGDQSPMPLLRELAKLRPWRAEPWYELGARHLDHCKDPYTAHCDDPYKALAYATMAESLPVPMHDEYMIEVDVYEYKAMLLKARCYEALGDKNRALSLYRNLPSCLEDYPSDRLFVQQRLAVLIGK